MHGTDSPRDRKPLGQSAPGSDCVGSQPAAEACRACPHRPRLDDGRSGAACGGPTRRQPSYDMALAATLRGSGRGRSAARQDAQAGQAADRRRDSGARGGADLRRPAASGDALDRPRDGQSGRHLAQFGASYWATLVEQQLAKG